MNRSPSDERCVYIDAEVVPRSKVVVVVLAVLGEGRVGVLVHGI